MKAYIFAYIWILSTHQVYTRVVDYWSNDFDTEQNCQFEAEIPLLEEHGQCSESAVDQAQNPFQRCKISLSLNLLTKCGDTQIKQTGELIYCKKRGVTKCCFKNYTCHENWKEINAEYNNRSIEYLSNKTAYFQSQINIGYKTCHSIDGYNATECADDCEKSKESEFAQSCSSQGGLFKCCIRRDKQACDECRFCCSLPFCTLQDGTVIVEQKTKVEEQKYKQSAIEKMYPLTTLYKTDDYRCYDPKSSKDPSLWKFYSDAQAFRKAKSQQELDQLQLKEFDRRVLNFEDPEVFKLATGKNYKKFWKEVYGFDFISHQELDGAKLEVTAALEYCANSRHHKFALECKKKKGFHKCCIASYSLFVYEAIRVLMYQKGFLAKEPEYICGKNATKKECVINVATELCTHFDPLTHESTTEYKTKLEEKLAVGGVYSGNQSLALRMYYCIIPDTCQDQLLRSDIVGTVYEQVHDQKDLCAAYISATKPTKEFRNSKRKEDLETIKRIDTIVSLYENYCEKSRGSIFMCPSKEIAKKYGSLKELQTLRERLSKGKKHGDKKHGKNTKRGKKAKKKGKGKTKDKTKSKSKAKTKQSRKMRKKKKKN